MTLAPGAVARRSRSRSGARTSASTTTQGQFVVEPGPFDLWVGDSSVVGTPSTFTVNVGGTDEQPPLAPDRDPSRTSLRRVAARGVCSGADGGPARTGRRGSGRRRPRQQRSVLHGIAADTWRFYGADVDPTTHLPLDNLGPGAVRGDVHVGGEHRRLPVGGRRRPRPGPDRPRAGRLAGHGDAATRSPRSSATTASSTSGTTPPTATCC